MLEKRGHDVKLKGIGTFEDCCCKAIVPEGSRYGMEICEIDAQASFLWKILMLFLFSGGFLHVRRARLQPCDCLHTQQGNPKGALYSGFFVLAQGHERRVPTLKLKEEIQ